MYNIAEVLKDYHRFMSFTQSLEGLRLENEEYRCFLKNHPGAADHFYGSSHGALTMRYYENQRYVFLHIASIDDGSIVFMGPTESKEEAVRRIELLVNHINSWDGWIPTYEQCIQLEKACGMYWNR